MILKIGEQEFSAYICSNKKYIVPFDRPDDSDLEFFSNWQKLVTDEKTPEFDCVTDIRFSDRIGYGVLKRCMPVVDKDEEHAVIFCERMEVHSEHPPSECETQKNNNDMSEFIPDAVDMKNKQSEVKNEIKERAEKRVGNLIDSMASKGENYLFVERSNVEEMENLKVVEHLVTKLREKGYSVKEKGWKKLKISF